MRALPKLVATTAITIAGLPSQAWAEADWSWVAKNDKGTIYYVDRNSIRRNGVIARLWSRAEYENDADGWKMRVTLEEHNCATGQNRNVQIVVYRVDGTTDTTSPLEPWRYAVPDTVGKAVHDFVCGTE